MTVEEWLGEDNQLGIDIYNKKYRYNEESFDNWWERVSAGNPEIKRLIIEKKFLFAGRILSNRGLTKASMANCTTLGRVQDSIKGIMDTSTKLAITFKAEQGQGFSLSLIRPKDTPIRNNPHYTSDGIVPFMELFNTVTNTVTQGGSRRGALLMAIDIWHKEAQTFISIKSDLNKINNANLSVEIDDKFMSIVQDDYLNNTETIVPVHKDYDGGSIDYEVCPIKLYKFLCKHAWESAEPGIFYTDRMFNYHLMQYDEDYKIVSTNACSEAPLPPYGMCMLSSFNIEKYVELPFTKHAYLNTEALAKDIATVVEAMDDIVTENIEMCPLQEQKDVARKYRNIGIGIMGLHGALIKLGIVYGSTQAVTWTRETFKGFFNAVLQADVALAEKRGSFEGYNPAIWDSDIIKHNCSEETIKVLKSKNCLRNASLISIAPTGTVGTMLQVSTGCEPYFALSYNRRTVSMGEQVYKVEVPIVQEFRNATNYTNEVLPDIFMTAHDIPWRCRIDMQAAMQEACDQAISSTCNVPKDISIDEIEQLYLYSWSKGCKGQTIYRDGCREGVLTLDTSPTITPSVDTERPKELPADFHSVKVKGEQFVVLIGLKDGRPYEIFAFKPNLILTLSAHQGTITKKGQMRYSFKSDLVEIKELELLNDDMEERATTVYTSMLLRYGIPIKQIIKTIKKVNDNIVSFSSAICRVLSKYEPVEVIEEKCPDCGGTVVRESGCVHCTNCGWSKCLLILSEDYELD